MPKSTSTARGCALVGLAVLASISMPSPVGLTSRADSPTIQPPPPVPLEMPMADADGVTYVSGPDGRRHATTLDAALQARLEAYLEDSRAGVAGILVADVRTGRILAMAQAERPETWGGRTHTALHPGFPAASLFKTVVTAAAFESAELDPNDPLGLSGGCAHVRESGDWMREKENVRKDPMTLRKAYGLSCNGFFAKIALNHLGLGIVTEMAKRFGWEGGIPNDFALDKSPFLAPQAETSSTHTVGRFAAGFGRVGMSAAHAAWMMQAIANGGQVQPLKLWRDLPAPSVAGREPIFSERTAKQLVEIMDSTTKNGTASFAFRRGKYKKLREVVGGKTGTLTGTSPKGLTTWFAGLAPLHAPEIAVASVVVLDDRWRIKAPHLAAEGFLAYFEGQEAQQKAALSLGTEAVTGALATGTESPTAALK